MSMLCEVCQCFSLTIVCKCVFRESMENDLYDEAVEIRTYQ